MREARRKNSSFDCGVENRKLLPTCQHDRLKERGGATLGVSCLIPRGCKPQLSDRPCLYFVSYEEQDMYIVLQVKSLDPHYLTSERDSLIL